MNLKTVIFSLAVALGLASTAHATDFSSNFEVSSDYRFRGVSQTKVGPEVAGGFDVSDKNTGVYAGTWLSNVSSGYYTNGSGIETDLYVGVKKELVKGLTLDVGSYNDLYARASNDGVSYNTSELYVGASYGPLTVKGSHSLTNYFGISNTHTTHYVTADVSQPVGAFTLIAHAGHTYVAHHNNYDYTDLNAGVAYNLPKGFVVTALYYTNTGVGSGAKAYNTEDGHKLYGDNVVVSLKKTF